MCCSYTGLQTSSPGLGIIPPKAVQTLEKVPLQSEQNASAAMTCKSLVITSTRGTTLGQDQSPRHSFNSRRVLRLEVAASQLKCLQDSALYQGMWCICVQIRQQMCGALQEHVRLQCRSADIHFPESCKVCTVLCSYKSAKGACEQGASKNSRLPTQCLIEAPTS